MSKAIMIRLLQVKDIPKVFDIRDSVKENYRSPEQVAELGFTPQSFRKMLEDNCVGWIGVYNGVDASFAVVNKVSGELLGLFTRPKFEGLGLATVLIDKAENYLLDSGIQQAWLTTSSDFNLKAHAFYRGK